ncbi:hypothetical protein B7463_g12421, partial [Scytalidium lignicola]
MLSAIANSEEMRKINNPRPNDFYRYWRLQEKDFFRLLVLFPSPNPDASIACSLLHQPISEAPPYEALSYTWGDEEAECPVFIDSCLFRVRRNLYCALRMLRHESNPRVLWIDAICIDQSHNAERAQQVVQMGRIYSNAEEVAIWLGEADDYSDLAMDSLREILICVDRIISECESDDEDRLLETYFASFLAKPDSDTCLHAISLLFMRPWWWRVWTVQEIGLARRATVYAGLKCHPWENFELFSTFLLIPSVYHTLLSHLPCSDEGIRAVGVLRETTIRPLTIKMIRELHSDGSLITLSKMVKKTINHVATDPRDKVYGVLGLVSQGAILKPNYDWSIDKVYNAAFKAIMKEDRDLSSFCWLMDGAKSRAKGLPSWVPDFKEVGGNRRLVPISQAWDERVGLVYCASSVNDKFGEISMSFQNEDTVLMLKGITVDAIDSIGDPAPDMRFTLLDGIPRSLRQTIESWYSLSAQLDGEHYTMGSLRLEAFWRTIIVDQKVLGYHPGYGQHLVGRERRLGRRSDGIPPRSVQEEESLINALEKQGGGMGGTQFNRRFFTTTRGYIGLAPPDVQKGDIVCVLLGGEVPYVLRPTSEECYMMIGEW